MSLNNDHVDTRYIARQMKDPSTTVVLEVLIADRVKQLLKEYGYTSEDVKEQEHWWRPATTDRNGSAGFLRIRVVLTDGLWCLYHESEVAPHMVQKLYKVRVG